MMFIQSSKNNQLRNKLQKSITTKNIRNKVSYNQAWMTMVMLLTKLHGLQQTNTQKNSKSISLSLKLLTL